MKRALLLLALGACASPSPTEFTDGGEDTRAVAGMTYAWSFDDDAMPPEFFNVLGDWRVEDGTLLQAGEWENPDYPRLVVENLQFTDLHLAARCKLEDGDTDRACGVLFRAEDSDNYFITRANSLEDNIRLYRVVDGDRQQIAGADLRVQGGEWHDLEVDADGDHLIVTWDGEVVIEHDDDTFTTGAIGVWTKADSITRFDDLTATAR